MNEKSVIVTGAANGIGKSIAETFAAKGAFVILLDKDIQAGGKTCESINSTGGKAAFIPADISLPDIVRESVRKAAGLLGKVDILINNAGFGIWKSPYELSTDEWDSVINTNLRGTFLCSREASVFMRKTGGGSIINISSTRAFMSEPSSEAYAASKGGIVALTHAMSASLSKDNIRVNCISPGWIETGDYGKLKESDHKQHFSGRVGKPQDIANACIFVAENDFINGENIIIDGGMTRKMIYEP